MSRLSLSPLREGYTIKYGCTVTSQPVPGGFSRFERGFDIDTHIVSVAYRLKNADYQYLLAFYRVWQSNPDARFLMPLQLNDGYIHDYECVFVPGSLNQSLNGSIVNVTFSVEVWSDYAGKFDVLRLSSQPYAMTALDVFHVSASVPALKNQMQPELEDSASVAAAVPYINLRNLQQAYDAGHDDMGVQAGTNYIYLRNQAQAYSNGSREDMGLAVTVPYMLLKKSLITYTAPDTENIVLDAAVPYIYLGV